MSTIIPTTGRMTVILSAERDWMNSDRNGERHVALTERLARQFEIGELLSIQQCNGYYKGVPEKSIAITGESGTVLAIGRHECERFEQESMLAINCQGKGRLIFTDTLAGPEDLGTYSKIHGAAPDAYTVVRATRETFTFI